MNEWEAVTPVLVIGGAVGDLVMTLPRLPIRGEDIEALPQARQIGGCAFNVARALTRLEAPVINGMPVGNGEWGAAIEAAMGELGLEVLLRHGQMDNGWCLALVEPDGERTFITVSGCESQWNKAQLATLPLTEHTLIYASGYELAGENGEALREWLTRMPFDQPRLIDPTAHRPAQRRFLRHAQRQPHSADAQPRRSGHAVRRRRRRGGRTALCRRP